MPRMRSALAAIALLASTSSLAEDAAAPSVEALALGREIAGAGTLATLIPLMAIKESDELITKYPDLGEADQNRLRAIGTAKSQAKLSELLDAQGAIYAQKMTLAELQTLADFVRSDAAKKQSALQPALIIGSMAVLDGVDFKKDVMAELCAQIKKGCDHKD